MSNPLNVSRGIEHDNMIELAGGPGLADGQEATVIAQPPAAEDTPKKGLPPGEGIRRSAGAWSDDPEGLDEYIRTVYERRRAHQSRPVE